MKTPSIFYSFAMILIVTISLSSKLAYSSDNNPVKSASSIKTEEKSPKEEDYLDQARTKISSAFDNFKKGDLPKTKQDLEEASKLLDDASRNTKNDTVRDEAHKMAIGVNKFIETLSKPTEEQEEGISRFWHQITSLINHETDRLVHGYVNLLTDEKTLKPLLSAKMHLFNAEHELFVSHDPVLAVEELDTTLSYLKDASEIARTPIKKMIASVNKDILSLKEATNTKDPWKKDSVIKDLVKASKNLDEAYDNASPSTKLRIEVIKNSVAELEDEIQKNNMRNKYDEAMIGIQNIINAM